MDDLGALDEVEAGEREDAIAVERRLEREVVAGQRLDHRQSGHAQGRFDPTVLTQRQLFAQELVECFDAIDRALLDTPQSRIEDLERARHLQADQASADRVDARGWCRAVHGRPSIARLAPIAS